MTTAAIARPAPLSADADCATDAPRALHAFPLLLAAFSLSHALHLSNGLFSPPALLFLAITLILTLLAIAGATRPLPPWVTPRVTAVLAVAVLAVNFMCSLAEAPAQYLRFPLDGRPFLALLMAATLLAALGLAPSPIGRRLRFPLFLAAWCLMGAWVIRHSPAPTIDVFTIHQEACAALVAGQNPHAITPANIYGPNSPYYAPGLSRDGKLTFGYPYPPLSLLLAMPGYLLGGDYRYSLLGALALTAFILTRVVPSASSSPGHLATVAPCLLLLSPRTLFMIEQGWTEPFLILLLTLSVFTALRHPRALPFALGLFFAAKQYTVLFAPAVILLMPRPLRLAPLLRTLAIAGAVGLAITLPFFLWGPRAFHRSVLDPHAVFRGDSLNFVALLWQARRIALPSALAFAPAALVAALCLSRLPRTPAAFAATVAATTLFFFAFATQAFGNYYFLAMGALCLCVAAATTVSAQPKSAARHST